MDPPGVPDSRFVRPRRQGLELFLSEEFLGRLLRLSVNPNLGHRIEPIPRRRMDAFKIRPLPAVAEVLFDLRPSVFPAAFFLRLPHAPGSNWAAVLVGQIQRTGVEHNRTGGPAQDGDRAVIDPDLSHHPAEVFEGVWVAGPKMFPRFGPRELQRHFAAESQRPDEKGKAAPPGGANGNRPGATPVSWSALSGLKVKRPESRSLLGTDWAHEGLEDGGWPAVAPLPEELETLPGRAIVLFQPADELALEGVEFAGALGPSGFFKALPPRSLPPGFQMEFERAGNLSKAKLLLGEAVPDRAIGLRIDQG